MTDQFDGMKECSLCESGTFDFVEKHYEKTGYVIYCRACWISTGGDSKP